MGDRRAGEPTQYPRGAREPAQRHACCPEQGGQLEQPEQGNYRGVPVQLHGQEPVLPHCLGQPGIWS